MLQLLKSFFTRKAPRQITDPDFGDIVYVEDVANGFEPYWEMLGAIEFPEHKAKVQCVGIPGDLDGPYDASRVFLTTKFNELERLWQICDEELIKTIETWFPEQLGQSPKQIFTLCAVNLEKEDEWEVCFESDPEHKWVYLGLQFKGDEIVSGTLDT